MIRLGVPGTDTGVGKTVVSCALAAAFVRRGRRVAAMKPIETGVSFDDPHRDGVRLSRASASEYPFRATAPMVLPDPVAPLVAARRSGTAIDIAALDRATDLVAQDSDVLLVEGAGGLLVPIADEMSFATLFHRWTLDVVIVAANRLGVINHVRLTCAAARAASLRICAVVLNQRSPPFRADSSVSENADVIAELENVPVFELPWLEQPYDFERSAAAAVSVGLVDHIAASNVPRAIPV